MSEAVEVGVTVLFSEALAIENPSERERFLESVCDPELREEVLSLLKAFERRDPFLDYTFVRGEGCERPSFELPRELGSYILQEEIGRGGMGVVYRAIEHQLDRTVALKVVRDAELATRDEIVRFYAEAQAAAALNHPGIVPVYEAGVVEGQHYFAMGFVQGSNLREALQSEDFSTEAKLTLIEKLTEAVVYAHARGVVHRDLKPENILLESESGDPVITDFGLARRMDRDSALTLTGQIMGTPGYMAPEQVTGSIEGMDERTDIHAIGAILYRLFGGRAPYQGETVAETLVSISTGLPPRLRSLGAGISADLEAICHKCLEKEAKKRYHSAENLLEDLKNLREGGPLLAKRAGPVERVMKLAKRNPTGTLAWVLAMIVLGLIIVVPLKMAGSARRHASELSEQNEVLEQTFQEMKSEQARTALEKGVRLAGDVRLQQALGKFLLGLELAIEAEDETLEELARYQIGTHLQYAWMPEKKLPVGQPVKNFRLSPDMRLLAVLSEDGGIHLRDAESGALVERLQVGSRVIDFSFAPVMKENHLLVLGSEDGGVRIFSDSKKIREVFVEDEIRRVGFGYDGRMIFVHAGEKIIQRWRVEDGVRVLPDLKADTELADVRAAKQADVLMGFTRSGSVFSWELNTGRLRAGPIESGGHILRGGVRDDGRTIFILHDGRNVGRFYRLEEGQREFVSHGRLEHSSSLLWADFLNEASDEICSSGEDGILKFGDFLDNSIYPLEFEKPIRRFEIASNEEALFTLHEEAEMLYRWQSPIAGGQTPSYCGGLASTFVLSSDGLASFVLRQGGVIRRALSGLELWKKLGGSATLLASSETRKSIFVIGGASDPVLECAEDNLRTKNEYVMGVENPITSVVSEDGNFLAILGNELAVIDLSSRQVWRYEVQMPGLTEITFSSDGRTLLLAGGSSVIEWFDWRAGKVTRRESYGSGNVTSIDVLPSRNRIVVGSEDRTAAVFEESSWDRISPSVLHKNQVGMVQLIDEGRFVVSAEQGEKAVVWEVNTGMKIGPTFHHVGSVVAMCLDRQSSKIYTVDKVSQVKSWPIPRREVGNLPEIREKVQKLKRLFF